MRKRLVDFGFIFGCLAMFPALLFSVTKAEAKPAPFNAHRLEAQAQRRSVIDYLYLLPGIGVGSSASRQERREMLLPRNHPIVDVHRDYLRVQPDSSPAEEITVFRFRGTDLIADSSPDFESDYNNFTLYRLQNGKLRDVTRQMLPMPADTDHLLYELPRFGTTIRVFRFNIETQSRHHIFDLQWRGGRFVKVP